MRKTRPFLTYLLILIPVLILLALFLFGMERAADIYEQPNPAIWEDTSANILHQFTAIAVLFVMGIALLLPFIKKLGTTQTLLLAYITGLFGFQLIGSLLLMLHIYFSLWSVLGLFALLLIPVYYVGLKRNRDTLKIGKTDSAKISFWIITLLAVGYVAARLPIAGVSFDSIQYRLLGKALAVEHYITPYFYYEIAGRTFIPSLLNAISVFFRFDYSYGLQNMFLVNSLLLFGYLLYAQIREQGFKKPLSRWLALAGLLVLASSFFVIFLGTVLVPNIFTAFSFCFLLIYMYRYIRHKQLLDLMISFFLMLAFCFTRVEGPLVAAFVIAYLSHQDIKTKPLVLYTAGTLVFVLMWYISFVLHVGANFEGRFLTFGRSMINVALLLLVCGYITVKNRYLMKHNDKLLVLYVCAVFVFTLAASLLDVDKLIVNARVTYLNMFAEGKWMTAWFGVGIFGMIAIIISKKQDHVLEGIIPIYLVLIIAIFAFREANLHTNWSDSGNRLLMHVYPLTIFVIAENLVSYFAPEKNHIE